MNNSDDIKNIYPPAVERAFAILDYFAENTAQLSIKEISQVLNIPNASAYRLVRCLVDYGYLRESPNYQDKFKLGYKPAYLTKMAFDGIDLITIASQYLKDLAEKTSQASQLCVLNDGYVLTLDQSIPRDAITIIAKLNEPIQINVSASGKVLLSLMSENKRKEILLKVWPSYKQNTQNTVMNMDTFLKQLNNISGQLYATDFEEYAIGIGCLAVPIFDNINNPIAAIGLTGPVENYRNPEKFGLMLESLKSASREINKELFYS